MSQLALRYEIKSKYHRSVLHLSCIIKTQARLSMQCHLPSMYYTPWYCRKRVYRKNTRIRIRSSYPSGSANLLYKEYAIYGYITGDNVTASLAVRNQIKISSICAASFLCHQDTGQAINAVPSALHVLYSLVLQEAGVPEMRSPTPACTGKRMRTLITATQTYTTPLISRYSLSSISMFINSRPSSSYSTLYYL